MTNKTFYSLAEEFAHGIQKAVYPSEHVRVGYHCSIYPAIHVEHSEAMLRAMDEYQGAAQLFTDTQRKEQLDAINLQYRDSVSVQPYGLTAKCDYVNEDSGEIIHRFELIRVTREELNAALWEMVGVIRNARQQRAYREMLLTNRIARI
jgi:hypothetical protein